MRERVARVLNLIAPGAVLAALWWIHPLLAALLVAAYLGTLLFVYRAGVNRVLARERRLHEALNRAGAGISDEELRKLLD